MKISRADPAALAVDILALLIGGAAAMNAGRWAPAVVLVGLTIAFASFGRLVFASRFRLSAASVVPFVLVVLAFVPLSVWASVDFWGASWPRVARFVWCIAVYFAVLFWSSGKPEPGFSDLEPSPGPTRGFLSLATILAGLGLLMMRPVEKLAPLGAMTQALRSLGLRAGLPQMVEPNELAGAVVLAIPLALLMSLASRGDRRTGPADRWVRFGAAALLPVVLLLTQSRGGWFACAAAIAFALASLRKWRWLILAGAAGAAAGLLVGVERLQSYVAYGGRLQNAALTGRPEIWARALQAIADVPFSGLGLGTFGSVLHRVYPLSFSDQPISHAHSLYLETALGLGVPGLLAFLALVSAAGITLLRHHRRSRPGSPASYWALGIAGGFVAHLLFGVADTVPLGSPLNVLFWFGLGLISASGGSGNSLHEEAARSRMRGASLPLPPLRLLFPLVLVACILLVIIVPWLALARGLSVNLASRTALQALVSRPELLPSAAEKLARLPPEACRAHWLRGRVAEARGDLELRDAAWMELMQCRAGFVREIRLAAPSRARLAEAASRLRPLEAESHFWLAELRASEAPQEAVSLYARGLELDPDDGERWLALGDLVSETNPGMALTAYVEACKNGDPGANGCYRAGRTAESLGDQEAAIRYYRMSRWTAARSRADSLELELRRIDSP